MPAGMIMLDTNIVIAYFAGEEKIVKAIEKAIAAGEIIALPTIVQAETLSYQGIDGRLMARMRAWFNGAQLISLDSDIADQAAEIRRAKKLKLIDSVIAATALAHHAQFATRDEEFNRLTKLEVLQW